MRANTRTDVTSRVPNHNGPLINTIHSVYTLNSDYTKESHNSRDMFRQMVGMRNLCLHVRKRPRAFRQRGTDVAEWLPHPA